jgi:hypothetical protein
MASIGTATGDDLIESEIEHPNNRQKTYKQFTASGENEITCDDVTVYLINAGELTTCPLVRVTFGNFSFNITINTVSQVSVLSEEIYRKLKL